VRHQPRTRGISSAPGRAILARPLGRAGSPADGTETSPGKWPAGPDPGTTLGRSIPRRSSCLCSLPRSRCPDDHHHGANPLGCPVDAIRGWRAVARSGRPPKWRRAGSRTVARRPGPGGCVVREASRASPLALNLFRNHYPPGRKPSSILRPAYIEYAFDTTRVAANLLYNEVLRDFPNIRWILAHAGGTFPYLATRLRLMDELETHQPPFPRFGVGRRRVLVIHFKAVFRLCQNQTMNVLLQTSPTLTIIGENFVQMKPLTKIRGGFLWW
jgi:hypothetical protein